MYNHFLRPATLAIVAIMASASLAQQTAPGVPTTVQLPTFSFFSVNTSVSIPDSGGAYSEAARQARMRPSPGLQPAGANLGGLRARRAGQGGVALSSGNVSAHATIIEPERPTAASSLVITAPEPFAARLQQAKTSSAGRPAMSVAEARKAHAARKQGEERAALELLQQGDDALARGNRGAAKVYYQSAARREAPSIRKEALARLQLLSATTSTVTSKTR